MSIDDIQFSFMPGKGITDDFIMRQVQERHQSKKKQYYVFVDFVRVPREIGFEEARCG